jgi:hypothetical protein
MSNNGIPIPIVIIIITALIGAFVFTFLVTGIMFFKAF